MIKNYLTIDVEDYYQVSAFEKVVGHEKWDEYPSRVETNTRIILDILDCHNIKATFFVLGWTAEKFPSLIRKISDKGHEVGCHSYKHRLIYNLTPVEFKEDTRQAKDVLEQLVGKKVRGYRAPSYSITKRIPWAFGILEELGFEFDSSIFPIYHDRYGMPDAPRFKYKIPGHNLIEYPLSTYVLLGNRIPVCGGGYFRIFPYYLVCSALKRINVIERKPFIFYLHPWEIDPDQPKIKQISLLSRLRHYTNLNKTAARFEELLGDFQFAPISASAGTYKSCPST